MGPIRIDYFIEKGCCLIEIDSDSNKNDFHFYCKGKELIIKQEEPLLFNLGDIKSLDGNNVYLYYMDTYIDKIYICIKYLEYKLINEKKFNRIKRNFFIK